MKINSLKLKNNPPPPPPTHTLTHFLENYVAEVKIKNDHKSFFIFIDIYNK